MVLKCVYSNPIWPSGMVIHGGEGSLSVCSAHVSHVGEGWGLLAPYPHHSASCCLGGWLAVLSRLHCVGLVRHLTTLNCRLPMCSVPYYLMHMTSLNPLQYWYQPTCVDVWPQTIVGWPVVDVQCNNMSGCDFGCGFHVVKAKLRDL